MRIVNMDLDEDFLKRFYDLTEEQHDEIVTALKECLR